MSNAADLTAADLIALLREHPGACGMLEVELRSPTIYGTDDDAVFVENGKFAFGGKSLAEPARTFRRWLTGAAVEAHIERELPFPTQWCDLTWSSGEDAGKEPLCEWTKHPTFLHALLAGLESHAKETA